MRAARRLRPSSTRLAIPTVVSLVLATAGCRAIEQGISDAIEWLLRLLLIALGLGVLGLLGLLGLVLSSLRDRPPRVRLALSAAAAIASIAASLAVIFAYRVGMTLKLLLALVPTPSVLWLATTLLDASQWQPPTTPPPYPGAPPLRVRTPMRAGAIVALALGMLGYAALLGFLSWIGAGRPSLRFPTLPQPAPTAPIGEPIVELRTGDGCTTARTASGRLLSLSAGGGELLPGRWVEGLCGDDTVCGVAEDGDVRCFPQVPGGAVRWSIDAKVRKLAHAGRRACWIARDGAVWCKGDGEASEVELPGLRGAVDLVLSGHHGLARLGDGVAIAFDAERATLGERTADVAAIAGYDGPLALLLRDGRVRVVRDGDARQVALPGEARQVAVNGYVGCALGVEAQLWCWDEFARSATPKRVALHGKARALGVGTSFLVRVTLDDGRFVLVDADGKVEPEPMPTDATVRAEAPAGAGSSR